MLGYDRESAARLAMLMSIPTILASGRPSGAGGHAEADAQAARDGAIAAAMAFVAALLALILMMRLLKTVSFTPYVIYRVILGVILLWLGYSGALTTLEVRRAFLDLGVLPGGTVGPEVVLQHQLHRRGRDPEIVEGHPPRRDHVVPPQVAHLVAGQKTVVKQPSVTFCNRSKSQAHDPGDPERHVHDQGGGGGSRPASAASARGMSAPRAAKLVDAGLGRAGHTHDGRIRHVVHIDRLKPGVGARPRAETGPSASSGRSG
jgi:hypothetical protein